MTKPGTGLLIYRIYEISKKNFFYQQSAYFNYLIALPKGSFFAIIRCLLK